MRKSSQKKQNMTGKDGKIQKFCEILNKTFVNSTYEIEKRNFNCDSIEIFCFMKTTVLSCTSKSCCISILFLLHNFSLHYSFFLHRILFFLSPSYSILSFFIVFYSFILHSTLCYSILLSRTALLSKEFHEKIQETVFQEK